MTHKEFCYWLQGFFEVMQPKSLSKEQISSIKEKLHETFDEGKPVQQASTGKSESGKPRISAYDLSAQARMPHHMGGQRVC